MFAGTRRLCGSHVLQGDILQGEDDQEVCTDEVTMGLLQEELKTWSGVEWSGGGGVVVLLPVRQLVPDLKIHFIPVSNVDSPCFRPISTVKF